MPRAKDADMIQLDELTFGAWLICVLALGLFLGGLAVSIFYELRYRRGIQFQRQLRWGLFK